jgi:hypothetical protein
VQVIVYIPTGLSSPELEILLSKAQSAIDEGAQTTVVTCSGGAGYACSLNIFGIRALCKVCKNISNQGILRLKGAYKHVQTPAKILVPQKSSDRAAIISMRHAIKDHFFEGADVGQAAYASYIGLSRDQDLEGSLSYFSLNRLLATSEQLTTWFRELIRCVDADRVILYNGRHNQYRPLLRVSQQEGVEVDVMEFSGVDFRCAYTFKNDLPQMLNVIHERIESKWEDFSGNIDQICNDYFNFKRTGSFANGNLSFVQGQTQGMLPLEWDSTKHNVVIFNSSEDEFAALGGEYDETLYINQIEAITRICMSVRDDHDIVIWLRIHPNLSRVRWSFAQRLMHLDKYYKNIRVILGHSPVSSYGLLDACDTVITFGSTMGVEAAYWGKPSILVGRFIHERLGSVYTPKSHEEVVALVRQRNLCPLPLEGALKFALFWSRGGESIPYFRGDRSQGFTFNSYKIKKCFADIAIYKLMKFIEKAALCYLFNYGFGRTRIRMRNKQVNEIPYC